MTTTTGPGHATAVVIGGGFAGLLAAWALRGHAEKIVVVERDRYPDKPQPRAGVPQAHHAHLLLEAGLRALEGLFPGLGADLLAAGASRVPMGTRLRWLGPAGWMARHDHDIAFVSCTRALTDHLILGRVRTEPRIEFREGTDVLGLTGSPGAVDGVRIAARGSRREQLLPAQLVIDASGRSSGLPDWLTALGCPPIREEALDPHVLYLSRLYHRAPDPGRDFEAVYLQTSGPGHRVTGSLLPVENDRWICSLGSMDAPASLSGTAGFEILLAGLRDPLLADTLASAHPVSVVRGFRPGPSTRRHYHRGAPEGLIVVGDAATSFNPLYGQGMTTAALTAHALRTAVTDTDGIGHDSARRARDKIAAITRDPWLMAAAEDARFPRTTGAPSGVVTACGHRYLDRVHARATHDPAVAAALTRVISLIDPPITLLHPRIAAAVLLGIG